MDELGIVRCLALCNNVETDQLSGQLCYDCSFMYRTMISINSQTRNIKPPGASAMTNW